LSATRALSKMATLGYACTCIGLILFIYGKASDNLTVDLIGGRVLVVGIMLLAVRILFWVAGKIIEHARVNAFSKCMHAKAVLVSVEPSYLVSRLKRGEASSGIGKTVFY